MRLTAQSGPGMRFNDVATLIAGCLRGSIQVRRDLDLDGDVECRRTPRTKCAGGAGSGSAPR